MSAGTRVLCFGNPWHGDDAFGLHVLRRLPADIEAFDAGTAGLNALPYLESCARAVLVDAVRIIASGDFRAAGKLISTRSAEEEVEDEIREAAEAIGSGDAGRIREELGDALFSLVNVARLSGLDADDALHGAIEKFRRRFSDMETELAARGTSVTAVAPDELERSWEAAKAGERGEKRS